MSNSQKFKLMITEGEGLTVEFKEQYTAKIDRDIVAFANTKGGCILLGIADNGRIIGQKLNNRIKSEIHNIGRNCDPPVSINRILQVEEIAVIQISEGDEKPYSCSSGFFRRLDAVTQKMSQKEVRMLFRETDNVFFESQFCHSLNVKGIAVEKVKTFLKETGASLRISKTALPLIFSSLAVMDKNKINNAGALMFASNIKKIMPHCESIMGAFKGEDKTHIYDRKDVQDDLFTQFNEAVSFLKKHLNVRSEISDVNRHDIYEIPIDALREAVVNAIIHRDYSLKGTSIYIRVFDDRVEIENPGGLLSPVTLQSLGKSSVRRNPIIADLFHRMGKVERMGSGIDRMRELVHGAKLREPLFETNDFFRVIFYRNPLYALKRAKSTVEKTMEKTVEKTMEKILNLIEEKPNITQNELMTKTGLSRPGVEWNIRKLKDKGMIRRIGSDRSGYWEINK
ncbi:MAG: ATP-binding protein [Phycisphaerales bacterium]